MALGQVETRKWKRKKPALRRCVILMMPQGFGWTPTSQISRYITFIVSCCCC